MKFQQYLASQLSHPSGFTGKFILGPLWNRRNLKLNELTLACLELQEDDRVLDIGFGGGWLLERVIASVKNGLAAGVDVSPAMVANAQARWGDAIRAGKVDIQCGRAEALPFPDGYFTRVSSVNSIFYWDEPQRGLSEIYRVLRQGGRLVLTYTCQKDLQKKGFAQYGVKTYTDEDIQQMLEHAGFNPITTLHSSDRHRQFTCMTGYKAVGPKPDGK